MTECLLSPSWRQFVCGRCGRVISECRPAYTPNTVIPTVEVIDSCAICAKTAPSTKS